MKQWKGLFYKEWMMNKSWLYGMMILTALIAALLPFALTRLNGAEHSYVNASIALVFLTLFFFGLFAAIQFILSLRKEMERPDVWLHTTASIHKLVFVKLLFSLFIFISVAIFVTIIVFSYVLTTTNAEVFDLLFVSVFFLLFVGFNIVYLNMTAFFLWIIYLTCKRFIGKWGIAVVLVISMIYSYYWFRLVETAAYQKIAYVGQLTFLKMPSSLQRIEPLSHFDVQPLPFYAVDLLLNGFGVVLLYLLSVQWFKSKVRL